MFLKRAVRQLDCPRRSFSEILKSEMWDYQKMKGGSAKSGAGQNIGVTPPTFLLITSKRAASCCIGLAQTV